jgi:hypothetical protein
VAALSTKGVNGQVVIDGDWLTIERKGFFGRVGHAKGDRRIPLGSITAVQVRPAGGFATGSSGSRCQAVLSLREGSRTRRKMKTL